MNNIILTKIGKSYINKQLNGPSFSLIGFVPFFSMGEEYDSNSDKSTLITYAMSGLFGNYYFNDIRYWENPSKNSIDLVNLEEYKDLSDLITSNRLYNIKYTNSKLLNGDSFSLYHLNLGIDNIKIDFSSSSKTPELLINGLAIFIQSNVSTKHATQNNVELFAIITFDEPIDLVKNDITWDIPLDSDGNIVEVDNEQLIDFTSFGDTEKTNVNSANALNINSIPYTFSDAFHDNSKTLYYDNDWNLAFVKGDLNSYQYDLTLINDSAKNNGFFFNVNPNTNSLEMQGTNRDDNIVFGVIGDNFDAKDSFIIDSKDLNANNTNASIFSINSKGTYTNSNHIFSIDVSSNVVKNSEYITIFGNNNHIENSNNSFIKGDNNVISGKNSFIVGNYNKSNANDVYIFGSGLSSNVQNSILLGENYNNDRYSFVYTNDKMVYGLEKDYGNFVVIGKTDEHNVQFSKDSIFLMNSFKQVNPSSIKNSLVIENSNVSAENSLIQGEYRNFTNSKIVNSISIASGLNTQRTNGDRVNSIIENSLDMSEGLYNVTSKNSLFNNNIVSAKDGININDSMVGYLNTNGGEVSNSIILSSNNNLNKVYNSLVINDKSKITTSGEVLNSIIQGNTQNSKFINSHLIGDLPINASGKEFKDCLVIGDGSDYVEIYQNKIVKKFDNMTEPVEIPLEYGLLDVSLDIGPALGEEWLHDNTNDTYEDKISRLLSNKKGFCRHAQTGQTLLVGELPEGKNECVCSLFIVSEKRNYILNCLFKLNERKVYIDFNEFRSYIQSDNKNPNYYNKSIFRLDLDIKKYLNFYIIDNKIAISNKDSENVFSIIRMCTCKCLNNIELNDEYLIKLDDIELNDKTVNCNTLQYIAHLSKYSTFINKNNKVDNIISNNFAFSYDEKVKVDTIIPTDKEFSNLIDASKSWTIDKAESMSANAIIGYYAWKDNILYSIHDTKGSTITSFDGVGTSSYTYYVNGNDYTDNKVLVTKNTNPVCSAYQNRNKFGLIDVDFGIIVNKDTKFNDYNICDLMFSNGGGEGDYPWIQDYQTSTGRAITKNGMGFATSDKEFNSFISCRDSLYTFTEDQIKSLAIRPNNEDIIDKNKVKTVTNDELVNYTHMIIWGKIVNLAIYTSTFLKLPTFTKLFYVNENLKPALPINSYVHFSNDCQMYPYNVAKYKNDGCCFGLELLLTKEESYDVLSYMKSNSTTENVISHQYNPFLCAENSTDYNFGFISHYLTYIYNSNKSISELKLNDDYFTETKRKMSGISDKRILRIGEYHYT